MTQLKPQKQPDLSIVIPTLNERDTLPITIAHLRKNESAQLQSEIIVADCNSQDGTPAWVREQGFVLVESNPPLNSKTAALNAGAAKARAPVILFLDADTLLPPNFNELILQELSKPGVAGGAFEFAFQDTTFALRIVEVVNRLRYRVDGKFYGDQGIFTSKEVFEKTGGYPALELMSVPHFCRLLAKYGKTSIIKARSYTSPRRFLEGGVFKVFRHDIYIFLRDALGLSTERYAGGYWKYNQERGESS